MKSKDKKALLLIDLQKDFFPGGALAIPNAFEILPIVKELLNCHFDLILASKDWHPFEHKSFADTHHKKPGERIILQNSEQVLWPVHCVQGSEGAEFIAGVDTTKIDKVFYKGTDANLDSYSTFFDNGRHQSTGLEVFLKSQKINEVYLAGLATDYCVKYSAFDSCYLGFKTFVIIDACRGVNLEPEDSQIAIEKMSQAGAKMILSSQLLTYCSRDQF